MAPDYNQPRDEITYTARSTTWVIALSSGLIGLGVLAILMPTLTSAIFTSMIGWIALVGGGLQLIEAFKAKPVKGVWLNLVVGALYAIAGLYLVLNPLLATAALTLVLGWLFTVEGILTIAMAFGHRAGRALSWLVVLNGVITLILGIFTLNQWPMTAFWVIGFYVGVSLVFSGVSLLAAALDLRKRLP